MLKRLAYPWKGHRRGCLTAVDHRRAGSSQTPLTSPSDPSAQSSFFMPFSHSAKRSSTCFSFISFSLASENYLILPCLSLQMVRACSGMTRSEPSDDSRWEGDESLILLFSFALRFFSFFCFLLSIFSPSLLLFKQSSMTPISTPSTFRAATNSSTSSPFFSPRAFRRPFATVLLFFPPSSFCWHLRTCASSSESSSLLLPGLISGESELDDELLRSISSLSLMTSPSLPWDCFLTLTSPRYFFSNLAF